MQVAIVGGGVGGLTLALELHDAGIECTIYEAVSRIEPLGVGINLMPHAVAVLDRHGLQQTLTDVGIATKEAVFANRFGQIIHRAPAGMAGGFAFPQISIHRGDLQTALLDAVQERLPEGTIRTGHRCTAVSQTDHSVTLSFASPTGAKLPDETADVVIGCDGVHSVVRKQYHPNEGEPRYSGINMWRGATPWEPFLSGASMLRAGWFDPGKMVIYPIRDNIDAQGRQLVNWAAEVQSPRHPDREWNRTGDIEDFIHIFEDWSFDWLDVPALIRSTERVLEYPMVDQDPLDRWTFGRASLLGDAAHPMVPRGSNGAGQAVLDARVLAAALKEHPDDPALALRQYESERLPATAQVVLTNRQAPPDILLKEVLDRTGDVPFADIDDVISREEIAAIQDRYNQVSGASKVVSAAAMPEGGAAR